MPDVHVDNSVRALALTESWFGSGNDVGSLLLVFAGNIVGAAMVLDRTPHRGRRAAAGYIDHLPIGVRTGRRCECGRTDCLQAVASDVALVSEAQRRGVLKAKEELDDLVALAGRGDGRAAGLLRTRARHVGAATALLIEADPNDFVRATSFGRHAVALSSATPCLDAFYRDPLSYPPFAP